MNSNDRHSFEVEQCRAFPKMGSYNNYWDIPQRELSELSLVAWLIAGGTFEQIPAEHRTENVIWAAVRHDREAFKLIGRHEVSDYRELSVNAVQLGYATFQDVPAEYIDEEFLIDATSHTFGRSTTKTLLDAHPNLITEQVAKAVCSRSISQARDFCVAGGVKALGLLKDEYLVEAIQKQTSDATYLNDLYKTYVLVSMIAEGFWPKHVSIANAALYRQPPETPAEALERLCEKLSPGDKVLHRCWLQSRPMGQVVSALQDSQKGLDELFEIYPEQELRKHMKSNRALRGRLLESDLGM